MTCKAFLSYFYIFVLLLFVVAAVEAEGWSLIIQSAAVGACITSHERCGTGVAPLLSLLICKPLSAATKQTVRKIHRLTLVARSCSTHKMLHRFIHSESDLVDVFCWTAGVPGRCTNARPVHVMTVHGRKGQKNPLVSASHECQLIVRPHHSDLSQLRQSHGIRLRPGTTHTKRRDTPEREQQADTEIATQK